MRKRVKLKKPDYDRGIANLACSVLAHYGVTPPNATLAAADALLHRRWRNVVVLLLDGMGVTILQNHLSPEGFFRRHLRTEYSSTFPPTTVAATTAILSGLTPNQSGWLGWTGYFPQLDRNIVYFLNKDNDTGESIAEYHAAGRFVPYVKITDRIRSAGYEAYELASFLPPQPKTYDDFCAEIERLCSRDGEKYIYAYWNEPDKTMHEKGVDGPEIGLLIQRLEERTARLAEALQDTLLMITADHGMIHARCHVLTDDPDVLDCLVRPPSIESRAVNFFVKDGMQAAFEEAFHKHFGSDFRLMRKAEVLAEKLFGPGENHPALEGMLGDYLAVATGDATLRMVDKGYLGEHAGMTEEEMTIPLIAVSKP